MITGQWGGQRSARELETGGKWPNSSSTPKREMYPPPPTHTHTYTQTQLITCYLYVALPQIMLYVGNMNINRWAMRKRNPWRRNLEFSHTFCMYVIFSIYWQQYWVDSWEAKQVRCVYHQYYQYQYYQYQHDLRTRRVFADVWLSLSNTNITEITLPRQKGVNDDMKSITGVVFFLFFFLKSCDRSFISFEYGRRVNIAYTFNEINSRT